MTIKEAETQYSSEVEYCCEQHIKRVKKAILIWNIISTLLIVLGVVLIIIGFTTPPEIGASGQEWDTAGAILEKMFGSMLLCVGVIFIISMNLLLRKAIKMGPSSFLQQTKNLYFNYLKCDDMSSDDKEFYKQKLEDIRNMELVSAINRASATASTAIMFSMSKK